MENNKTKGPAKNSVLMADMICLMGGALSLALSIFFNKQIPVDLAQVCFGAGLALLASGMAILTYDLRVWSAPPFVSRSIKYMRDLSHKRSFRKSQTAIVPAIVVAVIGIAVTIIAWIPLGYVCFAVIDQFVGTFYFPPTAMGTIYLMEWVVSWTPAVIIVGLLIYVIVSAFRTEYPSAPVGM